MRAFVGLSAVRLHSIKMNGIGQIRIGFALSFALYVICELLSIEHTNYMLELILLFLGTMAIGGISGSLISAIVVKIGKA